MPEAIWASNWEAGASVFTGRLRTAHDLFRRSVQAASQGAYKDFAAQWAVQDAESHAVVGQCAEARREVAAGLELNRDNFTLERAGRALALCGAHTEAQALARELATRFPSATLIKRIHLPVIAAALAVQRGESTQALQLLEGVRRYDHVQVAEFWPAYLRGHAYLQLRDGRAAGDEFQSILDHRGEAVVSPLYPLAHLGAARSAVLEGDIGRARARYRDFLEIWKGADADLPALEEAHVEYQRLGH